MEEYNGYWIKLNSIQGRVDYQVWKKRGADFTLMATFKTRREAKKWIDGR